MPIIREGETTGARVYYRYEERIFGSMDEFNQKINVESGRLILHHFSVIKETPCGVWIKLYSDNINGICKKFILTNARKKYACPTIEEARESFMARKQRQIIIYKQKLERARIALSLMKEELRRLGIEEKMSVRNLSLLKMILV